MLIMLRFSGVHPGVEELEDAFGVALEEGISVPPGG
jgi:hypothetical protein